MLGLSFDRIPYVVAYACVTLLWCCGFGAGYFLNPASAMLCSVAAFAVVGVLIVWHASRYISLDEEVWMGVGALASAVVSGLMF